MSRRNKVYLWLSGFILILGMSYAGSPWWMTKFIKHGLTSQGASDIELRVDYPTWRGIQLHDLTFHAQAGENQLFVAVPQVEVAYQWFELLTGTVARVRLPSVSVRLQPAAASTPSAQDAAALPLAGLLSGHWLSGIPVQEILVEQLQAEAYMANEVYRLQFSGQLRDGQLQVNGDLRLPVPGQRPVVFSLNAQPNGAARLQLASIDPSAVPMLSLSVNPIATDGAPLTLDGVLTADFAALIPRLLPFVAELAPLAGIEGQLSSDWQAQVNDAHWQITGEATVHSLAGRVGQQALPRSILTSRFRADPQQVTFSHTLRAAQAIVVEANGVYQVADGRGRADLTLQPVAFVEGGFVLSQLLKDWPFPFDVNAGQATGRARVTWQAGLDLQGTLQLDRLGGHYNQITFNGLNGDIALVYNGGLRTSQDAHLRVDSVDVGFPVEQIDLRFALIPTPRAPLPLIKVQQFMARLLGGRATAEPFVLDLGRDKNACVVKLEQLGLSNIMELEKQEGLEGSGQLDGNIPIELSSDGIVVHQGKIAARAPGGVIRYTPTAKVAAMAQSNQGISMVVKALSNFQYQILDVNTDYNPGGNLVLQVHLEGHNPEWQKGQPIHLNLNLEENIPTLLRSLQLSDEISNQVQKRYQKPPK